MQQVCTCTSTRACAPMAHVFAHTYADNCNVRCTHTTHTHMCTQRDAHVHAHAREHPAHLHTELTRQLIKDTAHAASFAALPARARACQLALPKTLRLWDHAQLSCLIRYRYLRHASNFKVQSRILSQSGEQCKRFTEFRSTSDWTIERFKSTVKYVT